MPGIRVCLKAAPQLEQVVVLALSPSFIVSQGIGYNCISEHCEAGVAVVVCDGHGTFHLVDSRGVEEVACMDEIYTCKITWIIYTYNYK